jgi:hypothetical protein
MKKLRQYVIAVTIKQEFSALKDVEASSSQEATQKAKKLALSSFSRELRDDIWSEQGEPEVVSTSIEDEYLL